MKMSIVLPHLHQGGHEQRESLLRPRVSSDPKISGRHVAPMALKVADGVYDTALLLVLEVYKSQLLLNYDHRIIDCFGLEGILKI